MRTHKPFSLTTLLFLPFTALLISISLLKPPPIYAQKSCYYPNYPDTNNVQCINCGGKGCTTQVCTNDEDCIFGSVKPPLPATTTAQGLFTNVLRIVFFAAGLWAFLNIIIAGYQFMNAGGDPKAITAAWGRIWQSLLGLIIIVSSFVLAGIVGFLIFNDPLFMFKAPIVK